MALFSLPPPPTGEDVKSPAFRDWFFKLQKYIQLYATNMFSGLDFTGSNLTSILTRNHNDLQNIQGGAANDYQHLTTAQLATVGVVSIARTFLLMGA
jgi:hypothetical protein